MPIQCRSTAYDAGPAPNQHYQCQYVVSIEQQLTSSWSYPANTRRRPDGGSMPNQNTVHPCSAVELKLAQRPNKLRPTSHTQPRKHDASKQCCFKADPPSTTLAQPQNNTGSTQRAHRATGIILKYSQQIQDSETTMAQCWANDANGGLAPPHRRITATCLL